jgi:proteasome lid subunit RPN8/RPN11
MARLAPAIEVTTGMILRLRAPIHATLLTAARHASPREACGFLLGRSTDDQMVAEELAPTLNAVVAPGSFAIPDVEVERVAQRAARAQLALIAVYHSHPSGLVELSADDARALRRSCYPWLVIAPSTGAIAGYSPDGDPLTLELE